MGEEYTKYIIYAILAILYFLFKFYKKKFAQTKDVSTAESDSNDPYNEKGETYYDDTEETGETSGHEQIGPVVEMEKSYTGIPEKYEKPEPYAGSIGDLLMQFRKKLKFEEDEEIKPEETKPEEFEPQKKKKPKLAFDHLVNVGDKKKDVYDSYMIFEEQQNKFAEILKDPENAKEAFIMSEIFKKKYI